MSLSAKSASNEAPVADIVVDQDEKIGKVVEEVNRFFRSIHADIEDWKLAMEDDGDGTRIFVRFQIHLDTAGTSSKSGSSRALGGSGTEPVVRDEGPARLGESPFTEEQNLPSNLDDPVVLDSVIRSDPDLGSFIEEWKRKRESGPHVEFHKAGAPLLDAPPEGKSSKRNDADGPEASPVSNESDNP
jgi:hypothetical protein